ncbi:uncharacterized protein YALI1_F37097g [Yarrowia lipolytica]|uniref:Uncharacterized protein n=1 Tax=Yarrowia lipolytica TaxID=4952 RepID=A0A1D8NQF1_YARLL|nr:hypothetical protein YALI1_F37097g [Yarrowia lipolytica]
MVNTAPRPSHATQTAVTRRPLTYWVTRATRLLHDIHDIRNYTPYCLKLLRVPDSTQRDAISITRPKHL